MGYLICPFDWFCFSDDISPSEEKICAICLENCTSYLKPCGHRYHYSCIKQWLNVKKIKKCPYCQKKYYGVSLSNGKFFFV